MDISPSTIDPSALAAGVSLFAAACTWVLGCLLDELTRVLGRGGVDRDDSPQE